MIVSCSQTIILKYMSFANVGLNKYITAVLFLYTQTNTPPPPPLTMLSIASTRARKAHQSQNRTYWGQLYPIVNLR